MTRKLSEADRAAVDLVFDRIVAAGDGDGSSGNGNGHEGVVVMTEAVAEERLSAVQRILSVLEEMPAPEPSSDLVARTLTRAAEDNGNAVFSPTAGNFIDPTRPMA
ncbi:MAG: hypothetical protein ABIP55_01770 [Tepidisphaeraceae bacterium]